MLRTSRRFDPETNTVVFGDGQPFSQNCMAFGGLQGFVDLMFDFSKGMASLAVDNAEYALVTGLCIFSGLCTHFFEYQGENIGWLTLFVDGYNRMACRVVQNCGCPLRGSAIILVRK